MNIKIDQQYKHFFWKQPRDHRAYINLFSIDFYKNKKAFHSNQNFNMQSFHKNAPILSNRAIQNALNYIHIQS